MPKEKNHDELLTTGAHVLNKIEKVLPVCHTRQMQREFTKTISKIWSVKIQQHAFQNFYANLIGDVTPNQNNEMDERLRQSILGEDPNLVVDLRVLNKGQPNDTFKVFFEALEKKFEEIIVADDQRHEIVHLSHFISVCDLIDLVTKICPVGAIILSKSTVLFIFTPTTHICKNCEIVQVQIPIKFKVQSRQLHASHIYSDVWPDHRFTYHSVQLPVISLFLELNPNMLIAGRTAPGQSWANLVHHLINVTSKFHISKCYPLKRILH